MNAIVGRDANDPAAFAFEPPDYLATLEASMRGLRIGVPTNFYFDLVDPEIEAAVRAAIEVLAGLGAEIDEVPIPYLEDAMAVTYVGTASEFHRVQNPVHVRQHEVVLLHVGLAHMLRQSRAGRLLAGEIVRRLLAVAHRQRAVQSKDPPPSSSSRSDPRSESP